MGAAVEVYVEVGDERLMLWETETDSTGGFSISLPVIRDGM